MLIRTFKKGFHWLVFLLVPIGILLWADGFFAFRDLAMGRDSDAPLYALLVVGLAPYPLIQIILAFGLVFFQAVLINGAAQANNLVGKQTWLPGLIFLVLMSSDPALLSFHPIIPANLFLILALIRLMAILDHKDPTFEVFNLGLLISLAALFYVPAFIFLGWLLVVISLYLAVSIRSIAATILGFLTPFFILGAWWFLTDRFGKFGELFGRFDLFHVFNTILFSYTRVFIIVIILLSILAIVKVITGYLPDKPVRIRNRFGMFFYYLLFSMLSPIFLIDYFDVHFAILMLPLSLFISVFLFELKRKWIAEFMFYVLLGAIILGKISWTGV